jgi:hypothetical protein
MKRTIFVLATVLVVFVAVFAVLALRPVTKVKAGSMGCSAKTLKGNYGLTGRGISGDTYFVSFSMIATFNGTGDYTGSEFNTTWSGIPGTSEPYTIPSTSYSVNPDCSCSWTIPADSYNYEISYAITLNGIAVDTGGDEVVGTWYDNGDDISGTFHAKRVAQGQWNNFF